MFLAEQKNQWLHEGGLFNIVKKNTIFDGHLNDSDGAPRR